MTNIWTIILVTFIAGVVGTGIGGLIGAICKKDSKKIVSLFLSLAAGIMLAVVCFDLLQEALAKYLDNKDKWWYLVLIIVSTGFGYLIVYLINNIIDKRLSKQVPHTSKDHPELHDDLGEMIHSDHIEQHKKEGNSNNLFVAGLVTALVIALHNFPEGMVIGASGITGAWIVTAIVIGLHNIPEGMAVSVPLISGGMKKWKAVLATAASGLPTVLGAIVGFYIGVLGNEGLIVSLSLASGAMLYVVFGELLPESFMMWKSKVPALMVLLGILIGFTVVLL